MIQTADDIARSISPVPPGYHYRLAGHHWLREYDWDRRPGDFIVLQWNPGAGKWSHSGDVATGRYVNTAGWAYVGVCEMPQD